MGPEPPADDEARARFQNLRRILREALDATAAERPAVLDRRCAGDATLRAEVEELVAAAEGGGQTFLESPVGTYARQWLADAEVARPAPGTRLGAYRVLGHLGSGGMGDVFLAERADGAFEQRVAIKVFRAAPTLRPQFLRERRILARLEHQRIARLIDGGETSEGAPFFVLEYVDGRPITEGLHDRDLQTRLAHFLAVCDAVAYAHRNLVVHRDLKPANILLTADGSVKLLDFGIAKLMAEGGAGDTGPEWRSHTPAYAAPEQLQDGAVTTAVDVWALGVLLYELLAERRPFGGGEGGRLALEHAILDCDPPPPSRAGALSRVSADLDAIVARALRKDPEHRYASVEDLAADVRRFSSGHAVLARGNDRRYRFGKFLRRNRVGVGAVALAALALVAGLGATLWQARAAQRAAAEASQEAARAKAVETFLTNLFWDASPTARPAGEVTAAQLLDRGASRLLGGALADEPAAQAHVLETIGFLAVQLDVLPQAEALFRRAVEVRLRSRTNLDDELWPRLQLANVLAIENRFADAEAEFSGCQKSLELANDVESDFYAMSLRGRGIALRGTGRYEEAIELLRRGRDLQQRVDPAHEKSTNVAVQVNDLAEALALLGRLDEASASSQQALAILRQGTNLRRLGRSESTLGWILTEREDYTAAETTLRSSLAHLLATSLGKDRFVSVARSRLGTALVRAGRAAEGKQELVAALPGLTTETGPEALLARLGLAEVELAENDMASARTDLQALLPGLAARVPTNHIGLARARVLLARVLLDGGEVAEARALLATASHDLPPAHPYQRTVALLQAQAR